MLWRILVTKLGSICSVTVLLQPFKVDPFSAKYLNKISFFLILILIIYFLRTPFGPHEWACSLWISLFGILFCHISAMPLYFWWSLCYCLPYVSPTSKAIYKLKLLHKLTTEHTLHNRVKSSITQNQDCCFS